jgi:hypothetical protein
MLMTGAISPLPFPSSAEVQMISSLPDPVVRNLRITDCYFRISSAFASRTGQCANWCTFATWASRQAGCTIRGEDMLARMDALLRQESFVLHPVKGIWRFLVRRGVFYPNTRLGRIVAAIHTPFDAFERASAAVARGNLKVFEEIGYEFSRYAEQCPPGLVPDSERITTFLDSLAPGDPPDGQAYLRQAFLLYQQQAFEKDQARRAQTICLANLLIGLHEQTRLEPEIREAMESVPETAEAQSRVLRLLRPVTRGLSQFARELTRRVVTESLMVLTLPGRVTLQLGSNLERKVADLLTPAVVPEFDRLLARFAGDDCGAGDWSDLPQRMRYITRLFCSYHADGDLFSPPFTPDQLASIREGHLPAGDL